MDELKEVIKNYVTDEYLEPDSDPIDYETPLISGGIVDSFSMVSLKRFLENKYQIQIPDEKATPEAFDSVNKIAELVKEFVKVKIGQPGELLAFARQTLIIGGKSWLILTRLESYTRISSSPAGSWYIKGREIYPFDPGGRD